MNKISIIGISGSGKSIFSRTLSRQTQLPLFHMDILFWRGNWEEVPEKEYLAKHQELIRQDKWIIEGYIDKKMAGRLQSSDLIIFLDYPGWLCTWRLFKRWIKHRKQSRPELPKQALENLKRDYLWKVFTRKERIRIQEALKYADPKKLIIIRSPSQLKKLTINQH